MIARQLGVAESTVRYHLQRSRKGAVHGRKDKVFAAAAFADVIDAWLAGHVGERPIACHGRALERLGGIPAVNRIDSPKTAIATGAGAWD